jgi:hypothetical protein
MSQPASQTQETQNLSPAAMNDQPGAKGNESTNEEDDGNIGDKFEQHAHAARFVRTYSAFGEEDTPKPRRTYSAFAEHLGEKETGCKRKYIERAPTVEEQCTAIIGNTPWPFNVCWLCGFPVGEQTEKKGNHDTMLQWIASAMGIQCVFINPLSARWDKQTCEHVNPINIAGTAFLNKGAEGYKDKHSLNIRMEYEAAHDLCNILKNEGYLMTLKKGKVALTFEGLTVAIWQINAWPDFLLNGSMNGPSLSSVICFVRNGKKIFLKSPIHGYLLLKVLETVDHDHWDGLFSILQARDELAIGTSVANDSIQISKQLEATIPKQLLKTAAGYFKWYTMSRKKTSKNPNPPDNYIHTIGSIASIHDLAFKSGVDYIVNTWKTAIKNAMLIRTQIFVDYIKEVDTSVDRLLYSLMKSSTQQMPALYQGVASSYDDLDRMLHQKLEQLKTLNPSAYDRMTVQVLTQKERADILAEHRRKWGLPPPTKTVRATQREKLPQPVAGLPVCMSLGEYTDPPIFRFTVVEKQKAEKVGYEIARNAVAKSLYSPAFMLELEEIVRTGQISNSVNPTTAAEDIITTVEEIECATTGNNNATSAAASSAAASNRRNNRGMGDVSEPAQQVTGNNNSGSMSAVSQPATSRNSPSAASSASATALFGQQQMQPAALFRSQSNDFRYAVPVDTRKYASRGNRGNRAPRHSWAEENEPKTEVTTSRNRNRNGGSRKHRNHRNHRTRKQKKNKKTRKNKKLTKRF